jgi:hypothetical protein
MRHLPAVGAARWAPCLAPGVPAPLARHPSPRHPAACGVKTLKPGDGRAQAADGQHSPVPKIPGIHRELPGPIHIVAIRQPAGF